MTRQYLFQTSLHIHSLCIIIIDRNKYAVGESDRSMVSGLLVKTRGNIDRERERDKSNNSNNNNNSKQ